MRLDLQLFAGDLIIDDDVPVITQIASKVKALDQAQTTARNTLQTNLTNGTIVVEKAECDGAGNNIVNTYTTKTELQEGVTVGVTYVINALSPMISAKVDKVTGKGLSTNDFTDAYKTKLDGIAAGAGVNVQSDWNQTNTSADDYIKNKPTNVSAFTNDSGYLTQHQDIGQATLTSKLGLGTLNNSIGWGTTTSANGYTVRWGSDQPAGGGFVISEKDGRTHIQIDGEVWTNEGASRLAHISEIPSLSGYATENYVNSKLNPTLLWQNPNPNSAFSYTGINLPTMNNYNFIIFEYKLYKDYNGTQLVKFRINDGGNNQFSILAAANGGTLYSRKLYSGDRSITVYGCIPEDEYLIPIAIYGTNLM